MGKLPFVTECPLFMRCEFKHAEEILAEYNDFYLFNMAQYAQISGATDTDEDTEPETDTDETAQERRQHQIDMRVKAATDHFKSLFGNKDFGESCMIGFRPAWYELQKLLFDEFKHKISVFDSQMNHIAPYLRNIASISLFAERIIADLEGIGTPEEVNVLKDGFVIMLNRLEKEGIVFPEYNKEKKVIAKFKKPEQYVEYARKLFGV